MHDKLKQYQYFSKILLSVTIVTIGLIIGFFMVHAYQQNLKNAEKHQLQMLQGIARTTAINIDGTLHEKLVCNLSSKDAITVNEENKTYEALHKILQKTQTENNLATPIYTLFKKSNCDKSFKYNDAMLFGVSSDNPYFRHQYEKFPDILIDYFEEGGTIGEYESENGHWLSAFAPIRNDHGKVVAVVQVDASFTTFIAEARATLLNESVFAFLFLLLIAGGFIYVYRIILKSMSKINVTLEEAVTKRTIELNATNAELQKLNIKLENVVKQRTTELQHSNESLQLSNAKLKSFARVASHDLRAPLRSITSFAQLFKRRYSSQVDESGNEYLDFITANAKKMDALITDTLTTSLIPEENTKEIKWVDLNKIMDGVIDNLGISIKKYNAKISFYNLPTLKGYSSEFTQLFQNLISNSIKYSRTGVPPIIKVVSHQKDDSFLVTVSDNGKGISTENLKNIFNEFERGSETDKDGYGIGLATCKRIVTEHGGTLKATSKLGEGTCFFITLKNRQVLKDEYKKSVDSAMGVMMNN